LSRQPSAISHQPSGKAYCAGLLVEEHWVLATRALHFFELLIFRINNLGGNSRQIFGTKGLISNIFRTNILAGLASVVESSLSKHDLVSGSASGLVGCALSHQPSAIT
jgi:hypothetical protein